MTCIMFDLLEERVADVDRKAEMRELRDENILMIDLRDPSDDELVEIIVNELCGYLATHFDTDTCKAMELGFSELHRLAASQHRYNQESAR
ncbi:MULTISPECIES: hypothetical protein [unclassified Mycolicibacterium]|uniref:hypothetical protein n=1 Tax=unclassified Mycolicibacterium TaxID=2636767 RepID=UPI0012DDCAB6|nr:MULTISPECIES: hypothetical protein [unclassified Mycolicibacterium]MUL84765.1 hypothetical protein [Mycolicibacterium sp. CBMA 329]MUL88540.1 hypothetical protein [Mycolicibacterium sp. CBMA 331]MUM00121.1 hypothetical protein [Mycolicibacterium sp. CBMA 334]MUM27787.1 hypothetical protein [Mycolicibacterium sp. CBMA 295]MUM40187.1 hypothetical protein [Mycolicibacterium sp. CBMA 247]